MEKRDIKILLVDDEPDILEIVGYNLSSEGYKVITAENGEEGVKKFIEKKPSLVIMDGDMPILDGYQAFKQIKEIDANAIVVIITGFSEFEPKSQEAIKEGLIKVISKPLGVDELLELAKKYTEIKVKE